MEALLTRIRGWSAWARAGAAIGLAASVLGIATAVDDPPFAGERGPDSFSGRLPAQFSDRSGELVAFLRSHQQKIVKLDVAFDRSAFDHQSYFADETDAGNPDKSDERDLHVMVWVDCHDTSREDRNGLQLGTSVDGCSGTDVFLRVRDFIWNYVEGGKAVALNGYWEVGTFFSSQQSEIITAVELRQLRPSEVPASA